MRTSMMTRALLAASLMAMSSVSVMGCGGAGGSGGGASSPSGGAGGGEALKGNPAPDFAVDSLNSEGKLSLEGLKGKVVLVDFWATWCEPCKKSFPKLQALNVKYKASGLEIVGISEDDDKTGIAAFGQTHGAKFPLGWDEGKKIAEKWGPSSMPSSFIVDRKGIVQFVHLGYHDGDEDEVEKQIKSLL